MLTSGSTVSTGEEMDFYEMVRRFNIPMKSDFWSGKTPELDAFHKEHTSHLIETQRLMSSRRLPRRRGPRSWRRKTITADGDIVCRTFG